jgi:hypothetical protein
VNNNLELNVYVFCYDDFPRNILTFMAVEEVSFGETNMFAVFRERERRLKEREK